MRPETFEIFTVSKVSGRKLSYANARARWRKKEVPPVFGGRNVQEPSESKHYGEIQRGTTPGNHKGTTVANKKKIDQTKKKAK